MAAETVMGVFANRTQAEAALDLLRTQGFAAEEVSLVAAGTPPPADDKTEELATGAAVGGVIGGVGGWLLSAALLTVPVIGPVLAAGPLVAALGGAAVGAGTGGLVAGLTAHGVSDSDAQQIEGQIRDGGALIMVSPTDRHEEARTLLHQAGALRTDFSLVGDETGTT